MVIAAVRIRGKLLDGTQRWTGSNVARVDHEFLPDLQGPIRLESVQGQDPIYRNVIGFCNCDQGLIRLYFVNDLAVCIRDSGYDHAKRSRCGKAFRVLIWDE